MIEVSIFTVVVAHPDAPSVVVLAEKDAVSRVFGSSPDTVEAPGSSGLQEDQTNETDTTEPSEGQSFEEPQLLPIWIGQSEAQIIMLLLEGHPRVRPLTHDLMANIIGALGSKVERVVIDRVMDSTFFAKVCLDRDGRTINIDARPSDSIALALRTGARIFVDKDVMNAAARQFRIKVSDGGELLYGSEDEMERFHSFIESVSPEDFAL